MAEGKKYKLLPAEKIEIRYGGKVITKKARRIKALRDIPLHGVKTGDIGGYLLGQLFDKPFLSHNGSAWVAGDAIVRGRIEITDDVLIKDNVKLIAEPTDLSWGISISGNVIISENATIVVGYRTFLSISDNAEISGDALLNYEYVAGKPIGRYSISGNAKILNKATIIESSVINNAVVKGNSIVDSGSEIGDDAVIQDYAHLGAKCKIFGAVVIDGDRKVPSHSRIDDNSMILRSISSSIITEPTPAITNGCSSKYSQMFEDVKASIDSYQKDIIKLLKYPTMSDLTDTHTLKMFTALREVEYIDPIQEPDEYKAAVQNLSSAFMVAESHARKIHHSNLDNQAKDSIDTARKMFSIAANEASSETEKKNAFKQGFKKLEGVVSVPDVAVDEFRIKVGLPELEQL